MAIFTEITENECVKERQPPPQSKAINLINTVRLLRNITLDYIRKLFIAAY